MNIENVISNEDLQIRLDALHESNWKIDGIAKGLSGDAKQIIDAWTFPTRNALLKLLNIVENKDYPNVYHNNQ